MGTLTEGDILWGLKKFHGLDLEAAEDVPISAFPHKRDYKAVTVTTSMDQLIEAGHEPELLCRLWMTAASSLASCAGRRSSVTAMRRPAQSSRPMSSASRNMPLCIERYK